jgi:hypothetical protein
MTLHEEERSHTAVGPQLSDTAVAEAPPSGVMTAPPDMGGALGGARRAGTGPNAIVGRLMRSRR